MMDKPRLTKLITDYKKSRERKNRTELFFDGFFGAFNIIKQGKQDQEDESDDMLNLYFDWKHVGDDLMKSASCIRKMDDYIQVHKEFEELSALQLKFDPVIKGSSILCKAVQSIDDYNFINAILDKDDIQEKCLLSYCKDRNRFSKLDFTSAKSKI